MIILLIELSAAAVRIVNFIYQLFWQTVSYFFEICAHFRFFFHLNDKSNWSVDFSHAGVNGAKKRISSKWFFQTASRLEF